jgi:ribosomal protein L1
MTYQQLLNQLQSLTKEQLSQDVAIFDSSADEYYQQTVEVVFTVEADVLDADHAVIRF